MENTQNVNAFSEVENSEIILRLEKWQVPLLIGAAQLGTLVQDWCSRLLHAQSGCVDGLSMEPVLWISAVGKMINEIKKKTVTDEKDDGYFLDYIQVINKLVAEQCKKYETESILQ